MSISNETRTCGRCNGTRTLTVDSSEKTGVKGSVDILTCPDCDPGLWHCNNGHVPIQFRARSCPLCWALLHIKKLELTLRAYRGSERTYVQKMQSKRADDISNAK